VKNIRTHLSCSTIANERKILKAFLLNQLHKLFLQLFESTIQNNQDHISMECYAMDNKMIQLLIHRIVETGDYTLQGVAYYTRIPFDVIFDAACCNNNQLSLTLLIRIMELYLQVNPDIERILIDRLLEIKEKNNCTLLSLLNEL
jgi:hypothetical protein